MGQKSDLLEPFWSEEEIMARALIDILESYNIEDDEEDDTENVQEVEKEEEDKEVEDDEDDLYASLLKIFIHHIIVIAVVIK